MPKFSSRRSYSLDSLGKEWKDCYLLFESTSIRENNELSRLKLGSKSTAEVNDIVMKFISSHFIEGTGYDSDKKEIVKIQREELDLLPSSIQESIVLFLIGGVSQ